MAKGITDSESKYAFCGEKIKLNPKDYQEMKSLYPKLDLRKELIQLDMELRKSKSWWMPMQAKLRYRNDKAVGRNYRSTRDITLEEQLTDRSWADGCELPKIEDKS